MDANRTTSGYRLQNELARFCLPEAHRDPSRKLAWTNSICILFLIIGLVGARQASPFTEPLPAVEEAVPTIVETIKPPATAVQKIEATAQSQPAAPQTVAVTIDTPAINFSVPTIGNLIVPNALARAPAVVSLAGSPRTMNVSSTGESGDRPQPPYPPLALSEAEEGSVVIGMTVDENGTIVQITLKSSSGYPVLDRATLGFIKNHWHVLPANGSHSFETTITYHITLN